MPKALLSQEDRDLVFSLTQELLPQLDGRRIFLTGATGLFGKWLVESLMEGADRLSLSLDLCVLVRDQKRWEETTPHSSHHRVKTVVGDVRNFDFPPGEFSDIVHLATPASASLNKERPLEMWDTVVEGMRHVLEFARVSQTKRVLFTSSGAVYGPQPPELSHLPENYPGAPDPLLPGSAYGEGKRAAEQLCALYAETYGIQCKIARCFAFVGPHLPLDTHFAAGNFIRDALRGGPIRVAGDGTPYRSYLYMADLMPWLLKIWLEGRPLLPYNVGSERPVSVRELAELVGRLTETQVEVAQKSALGVPAKRYVPSTRRAREELGLKVSIELEEALERTLRHYRKEGF